MVGLPAGVVLLLTGKVSLFAIDVPLLLGDMSLNAVNSARPVVNDITVLIRGMPLLVGNTSMLVWGVALISEGVPVVVGLVLLCETDECLLVSEEAALFSEDVSLCVMAARLPDGVVFFTGEASLLVADKPLPFNDISIAIEVALCSVEGKMVIGGLLSLAGGMPLIVDGAVLILDGVSWLVGKALLLERVAFLLVGIVLPFDKDVSLELLMVDVGLPIVSLFIGDTSLPVKDIILVSGAISLAAEDALSLRLVDDKPLVIEFVIVLVGDVSCTVAQRKG